MFSYFPRALWLGFKYYVFYFYYSFVGENDYVENYDVLNKIVDELNSIKTVLAIETVLKSLPKICKKQK